MRNRHLKNGTYVTSLRDFGGLDISGTSTDDTPRFSRLENMWRDYRAGEGDAIESFPGFRILTRLSGAIHGIWQWQTQAFHRILVHAGTSLYWGNVSDTDGTTLTHPLAPVAGGEGTLADEKSTGFSHEDDFCLLDTAHYFVLRDRSGTPTLSSALDLYTPLTYSDGVPYEQQNILSRYTVNRYHLTNLAEFPCGSHGLRYSITDRDNHFCEVTGYACERRDPMLYIPAETVINGIPHRVQGVASYAFEGCSHLLEVYLSEGISYVNHEAFADCASLYRVFLADSVTVVHPRAFRGCPALVSLILGRYLDTIGAEVAQDSPDITLYCHGDEDSFALIDIHESNTVILCAERYFYDFYPVRYYLFPLYEDIEAITEVTLDGTPLTHADGRNPHYTIDYTDDGRIAGMILYAGSEYPLLNRELRIRLRLHNTPCGSVAGETDFAAGNGYDGPTHAALAHCTQVAVYDGRIFFSGNSQLPSTVFYTARDLSGKTNPAYVGIYNYFCAGDGIASVTALLPTGAYLAVLTGKGNGNGSVTYYRGADTNRNLVPRIYVMDDRISAPACGGVATVLRDDPVFLSSEGLEAISREALNTERSLKHRSSLIDPALCAHDPREALHAVFDGYLVLLFPDGEAFLADSRRSARTYRGQEYEWYHLLDIGAYSNDLPVYRYADGYYRDTPDRIMRDGVETTLLLHPNADALPFGCDDDSYPTHYPSVMMGVTLDGFPIAYTVEGTSAAPHCYLLRATEERAGGTFSAPTALSVVGEKLFFGCENGCLAVVNTDRRGVMDEMQALVYTPAAYARQWGHLINPAWYSYGGHRYLAGLVTRADDSGVANYTKSTLRGTTVLDMKAGIGYGFSVEVRLCRTSGTETKETLHVRQGGLDFAHLDFGNINFGYCEDCIVTINERSRRYLKKQYCLFSDAFARPFGLRALTYTWKVEGKVKNA